MIPEARAYGLLSQDETLNRLMDRIRGKPFGNGFKQGIFTYDVPEKPTNLKKATLAPFIRINTIFEMPVNYADDGYLCIEKRIVVEFWCLSAKDADAIGNCIDTILEDADFERYTANETPRYKDSDIDLLMNVRKYRFFDWVRENKEEEKE